MVKTEDPEQTALTRLHYALVFVRNVVHPVIKFNQFNV